MAQGHRSRSLFALLEYMMAESITADLRTDRLFPQLWAMAMVEPAVQSMLDVLYQEYLEWIEDSLREQGVEHPEGDGLAHAPMGCRGGPSRMRLKTDGRAWRENA